VIVVSDSSPLIGLASISQLELLHQLYGDVLVPEAVWQEVVVKGAGRPGALAVANADWIHRRSVANRELSRALQRDLGTGEAEAIALAVEVQADLLVMDDPLGRDMARHLDLKFVGVVGVLIEARHKGLIGEVRRYLDELRRGGFRIKETLHRRVLADEGE
jgi:predicted nucleic acid-binding protein